MGREAKSVSWRNYKGVWGKDLVILLFLMVKENKFSCRILAFKFAAFSSFTGLPKEYKFRMLKTLHFCNVFMEHMLFLLLKNLPEVVTAGKLNISVPG